MLKKFITSSTSASYMYFSLLSRPATYQVSRPTMQPLRVFLGFLPGFSLAILYCHYAFSRDPTSYFFNPDSSYTPLYSHHREEQALSFITQNSLPSTFPPAAAAPPKLCIGILTVHRQVFAPAKCNRPSLIKWYRSPRLDLLLSLASWTQILVPSSIRY